MSSNTEQTNKRKIADQDVPGTNTNTNTNNSTLAEISVNVPRTPGGVKKQRLQAPKPAVGVFTDKTPVPNKNNNKYIGPGVLQAVDIDEPVPNPDGFIRVGNQPIKAHEYDVRSAPLPEVISRLRPSIRSNSMTDAKLPGAESAMEPAHRENLLQELQATMVKNANNDLVKRVCDYTGNDLIWTPGPKAMSMEATYPFTSHQGILLKTTPIIVLSLLAVILNADLETQRRHLAWAFNALCNTANIHFLTGSSGTEKASCFKDWTSWDKSTQEEMSETRRTAKRTVFLNEKLSNIPVDSLFRVSTWLRSDCQNDWWDREYSVLQRIAESHGLMSDDFEFYLTIENALLERKIV